MDAGTARAALAWCWQHQGPLRLCWGLGAGADSWGDVGGTWLLNPSTVPIQDVFSNVGGQKRKRGRGGEDGPRKKPQQPAQQDEDFYIPYRPKDFESERG